MPFISTPQQPLSAMQSSSRNPIESLSIDFIMRTPVWLQESMPCHYPSGLETDKRVKRSARPFCLREGKVFRITSFYYLLFFFYLVCFYYRQGQIGYHL